MILYVKKSLQSWYIIILCKGIRKKIFLSVLQYMYNNVIVLSYGKNALKHVLKYAFMCVDRLNNVEWYTNGSAAKT